MDCNNSDNSTRGGNFEVVLIGFCCMVDILTFEVL